MEPLTRPRRPQPQSKVARQAVLQAFLSDGRKNVLPVCCPKRAEDHSTAADLRAVEIRGQAMDQVATVRATPTTAGFDWADFGIGAGSMLGLVLLAGGVATRVHGRKGSVRPRPAP